MAQGDFWADQDNANRTIQILKSLKSQRDPVVRFEQGLRDLTEFLGLSDNDQASLEQLTKDLSALEKSFGELEIKRLFGGPEDIKHAIVAIHSGAGGTESCDWTEMLLRMYRRWADSHGYVTEMID